MKGIHARVIFAALVLTSAVAHGAEPLPLAPEVQSWAIGHEVEVREHAHATGVEIGVPGSASGIARVRFERKTPHAIEAGVATVTYVFVDPRTYPGTTAEQEHVFSRNPTGLAVIDYEVRPAQGPQH